MNASRVVLSPEVSQLLSSLRHLEGRVAFSRESFLEWRGRLRTAPRSRRALLKVELLAAARRMVKQGIGGATEAIGQLLALANEVSGPPRSARSWSPAR